MQIPPLSLDMIYRVDMSWIFASTAGAGASDTGSGTAGAGAGAPGE